MAGERKDVATGTEVSGRGCWPFRGFSLTKEEAWPSAQKQELWVKRHQVGIRASPGAALWPGAGCITSLSLSLPRSLMTSQDGPEGCHCRALASSPLPRGKGPVALAIRTSHPFYRREHQGPRYRKWFVQ